MKLVNDTDPILRQHTVNFDFNSYDPELYGTKLGKVSFISIILFIREKNTNVQSVLLLNRIHLK